MTALVFFLLCVISVGALQLDDCQGGYIYITNDTSSPSDIKCSGVAKTDTSVTWFVGKNSNFNWVALCSQTTCNLNSPDVTAVRPVDSGISILRVTQNHQQVAGGDAVVRCQTNSGSSADCTIRIIDKLPSVTITGASASYSVYAGDKANLRCVVSPATEPVPSPPVTYTWTWTNGGAVRCVTSIAVPGVCRFYLTSQHNKAGIRCDLSYRDYPNIPGKTSTVTLNVKYPPPQPPVITGNREVSVGESLTLECRVYSGNPLVTSVNFYCEKYRDVVDIRVTSDVDDTSYVSSNITIQSVKASNNGDTCMCGATWEEPEFHVGISIVTLTVSGAGTAQPLVTSTGTAQPSVTSVVTTQPSVTTTRSHGNTDSSLITPSTTIVNPAITPLKSTVTDASSSGLNVAAIAGGVVAAGVVCGIVGAVVSIAVQRYLRNRNYARPGPRTEESNYTDLTVYEQVGNNTTINTNSYANVGSSPVSASSSDENYYNTRGLGGSNPENHTYHNEALATDNTGTYEGLQFSEVGLQNTYTQLAKTKK